MPVVLALVVVVGFITASFYTSAHSGFSHTDAQALAAVYGYVAALTWGLSVVGYLIWMLAIRVLMHPLWNGVFNFLAAIAAAAAAGFATI